MKLNSIGLGVLILGTIIVVYALLFMDVSIGGDVVNVDLLNQRLMLVVVGSLAVLLGAMVLLATKLTDRSNVTVGDPVVDAAKRATTTLSNSAKSYGADRVVKVASKIVGVIGLLLLVTYLFSPGYGVSGTQGLIGLALLVTAAYLNRDALRPKSSESSCEKKRWRPHLIASIALVLSGVAVLLLPIIATPFGVYMYEAIDTVAPLGMFLFAVGVLYLIGSTIWIWWFNHNIDSASADSNRVGNTRE